MTAVTAVTASAAIAVTAVTAVTANRPQIESGPHGGGGRVEPIAVTGMTASFDRQF